MSTGTHPAIRPLHFRFREQVSGGGHVQIKVFAGTTPGSLALCGGLVMRREEWAALRGLLCGGVDGGRGTSIHLDREEAP